MLSRKNHKQGSAPAWRLTALACGLGLGLGWAASASAFSLSEALDAAWQRDPTVAVSQAQFEADREAGVEDLASLRPVIGVKGTSYLATTKSVGVFGSASDEYPEWGVQASLRQPLFRLDWAARADRAQATLAQADLGLRDRNLTLQRRVAERYFAVLQAQDALTLAEAEAKAVHTSLSDTQKRYDVELAPGTDLKEAQSRDDLAQAKITSARRALDNARDELDETTGQGRAALPSLPETTQFPPLTPADPEQWVIAARDSSPALALAQQKIAVAKANVKSRESDRWPTLDLVGSASRNDSNFVFGQRQDDARVGVELNLPIYSGSLDASNRRAANANLRGAESDLARIKSETERSVRQLHRSVETGYIEVSAYERSVTSARAAEVAAQNGYEAGTRTITDVLDAKSRTVQSQRDLNNTRYTLLLNILQLKQTVGTLNKADFVQIDQLLQAGAAGSNQ